MGMEGPFLDCKDVLNSPIGLMTRFLLSKQGPCLSQWILSICVTHHYESVSTRDSERQRRMTTQEHISIVS